MPGLFRTFVVARPPHSAACELSLLLAELACVMSRLEEALVELAMACDAPSAALAAEAIAAARRAR